MLLNNILISFNWLKAANKDLYYFTLLQATDWCKGFLSCICVCIYVYTYMHMQIILQVLVQIPNLTFLNGQNWYSVKQWQVYMHTKIEIFVCMRWSKWEWDFSAHTASSSSDLCCPTFISQLAFNLCRINTVPRAGSTLAHAGDTF